MLTDGSLVAEISVECPEPVWQRHCNVSLLISCYDTVMRCFSNQAIRQRSGREIYFLDQGIGICFFRADCIPPEMILRQWIFGTIDYQGSNGVKFTPYPGDPAKADQVEVVAGNISALKLYGEFRNL